MICPNCKKQIDDDSNYCEFCGTKIVRKEHIIVSNDKSNKKKYAIFAAVIAIAIVALLLVVFLYPKEKKYQLGLASISTETDNSESIEIFSELSQSNYKDSKTKLLEAKANAAIYYSEYGSFTSAESAIGVLKELESENYAEFDVIRNVVYSNLYNVAIDSYTNGSEIGSSGFEKSMYYFSLLGDYMMSKEFLDLSILCYGSASNGFYKYNIKDYNSAYSRVVKNMEKYLGAEKEVLVFNDYTAKKFLNGTWKSESGNKYFTINEEGDIKYNLPADTVPNSLCKIRQGVVNISNFDNFLALMYNNKMEEKDIFKISVIGKDKINIYCYKDGNTYSLIRQ